MPAANTPKADPQQNHVFFAVKWLNAKNKGSNSLHQKMLPDTFALPSPQLKTSLHPLLTPPKPSLTYCSISHVAQDLPYSPHRC